MVGHGEEDRKVGSVGLRASAQRAQARSAADGDDARAAAPQAKRVDDLDDAAGAVARHEWAKHGLGELEVTEEQQADTEDTEDHRARPVRPELKGDVEELMGHPEVLVDLLQPTP